MIVAAPEEGKGFLVWSQPVLSCVGGKDQDATCLKSSDKSTANAPRYRVPVGDLWQWTAMKP
jgi:hypothetical protein